MSITRLWLTGLTRPSRGYDVVRDNPAPSWGFLVVLVFNLAIAATTLLAQHLLGRRPLMESALTFLPTDGYFLPEMFFLPPLRILVWLMSAGVIHLGLRLARTRSDYDLILNIGGFGYFVIMPVILVSDWILVALDVYRLAQFTHPLAMPWSAFLTAVGLKRLLNVKTAPAVLFGILGEVICIPLLAVFAR